MLLLLERRPLRIAAHAFLPRFRAAAGQSCWPEHLLCIGARVYACRTKTFSALALYQGTRLRVPHKNLFRTCFVSGHAFTRAAQKPFPHLLCIRARVYACRKCLQWTRASAPEIK